MTACDYEAEFRDPHTQGQIMLTLFFAECPLYYPELAEAMNLGAASCRGQLRRASSEEMGEPYGS